MLSFFHKMRAFCVTQDVEFDYTISTEGFGIIKTLRHTKMKEFNAHPIVKMIQKCSTKIRNSMRFPINVIANEFQVHPLLFVSKFKELSKSLQFTFMTVEWGMYFREVNYVDPSLLPAFDIENLTDLLMANFKKHRKIQTDKLDAYFMLISKYAKKSIENFGEQDIYMNHNSDMEQYVRTYFKEGAESMKQLLFANGVKSEPVIYLQNTTDGT